VKDPRVINGIVNLILAATIGYTWHKGWTAWSVGIFTQFMLNGFDRVIRRLDTRRSTE
jgi:hypothetical protein